MSLWWWWVIPWLATGNSQLFAATWTRWQQAQQALRNSRRMKHGLTQQGTYTAAVAGWWFYPSVRPNYLPRRVPKGRFQYSAWLLDWLFFPQGFQPPASSAGCAFAIMAIDIYWSWPHGKWWQMDNTKKHEKKDLFLRLTTPVWSVAGWGRLDIHCGTLINRPARPSFKRWTTFLFGAWGPNCSPGGLMTRMSWWSWLYSVSR